MNGAAQLTKNQILVLGALTRAGAPLGAYAILDELRGKGFRAPLQVYRALDKLIEQGLVHRIESLNAFVACPHPDDHGATTIAFAICDSCGRVSEFADMTVQQRLARWSEENRFSLASTTLEIHGHCASCRAAS